MGRRQEQPSPPDTTPISLKYRQLGPDEKQRLANECAKAYTAKTTEGHKGGS